jgi:hypothetical protein
MKPCAALALVLALVLATRASAAQESTLVNTLENSRGELHKFLATLLAVKEPDQGEALPVVLEGEGLSMTYHVVEKPVILPPRTVVNLSRTLLSVDAYYAGMSACLFDPAVAFRFKKGAHVVQALICFRCSELVFEDGHGRALSGRFRLDSGRSVLLKASKEAFPDNEDLARIEK